MRRATRAIAASRHAVCIALLGLLTPALGFAHGAGDLVAASRNGTDSPPRTTTDVEAGPGGEGAAPDDAQGRAAVPAAVDSTESRTPGHRVGHVALEPSPEAAGPPQPSIAATTADSGWRAAVRLQVRRDRLATLTALAGAGTFRTATWLALLFRAPLAEYLLFGATAVHLPLTAGLVVALAVDRALHRPASDPALRGRLRGVGIGLLIGGGVLLAAAIGPALYVAAWFTPVLVGPILALPLAVLVVGAACNRLARTNAAAPQVAVTPTGLLVRW